MSVLFARALLFALSIAGVSAMSSGVALFDAVHMPGHSFSAKQPPLTPKEQQIAQGMRSHIGMLAGKIGERNMQKFENLEASAAYIESSFSQLGYQVHSQTYAVIGHTVRNLEAELRGKTHPDEIVVVGAHYDSVPNCPGANDNASGVSGVLELAKQFANKQPDRTIRFVAFVNEEDPYFGTKEMGSYQYATRCKERHEKIVGMIAVETIGYHSERANSQRLPPFADLVYPDVGNFVWFVGNQASRDFVRDCIGSFRNGTPYPSQGVAAPEWIEGIDWCDQLYFWKNGYNGLMVTDSAPYRYPYYHQPTDTIDKIDYKRTGRIIGGLTNVIEKLAGPSPHS